MLVLAFDASTPVTTVALGRAPETKPSAVEPLEVLAEVSNSSRGASETLLESVEFALRLGGVELSDLDRILAGVGPGTFTGIRIAAATARSLSRASGVPLSAGSTLAALAVVADSDANPGGEREVLAVLDARRREVFVHRFRGNLPVGKVSCVRPEEVFAGSGVSGEGSSEPLIVGDGAVRYREVLEGSGRIPPDSSPLHRVSAAGHLLAASLEVVCVEELVPIYLRQPDAEVRREKNPWSR